jgi:glycosyltransferase involved in cell wall biosynthesis
MRVCFFGAYDPAYPRNRILREGLVRAGDRVIEARGPELRMFRRYPALIGAFLRSGRESDVMLVPEFRHKDMPLAWLLRGRRRLVFDPLVSRWDTLVGDWRLHAPGSAQARWNRSIDRRAFGLADVTLCDTWAHGALFESLGAPRERLRRVPVGAEDAFFEVAPPLPAPPVRIVYLGGFLPLHGVPTIIEALAGVQREAHRVPEYRAVLFGRGIEWQRAREMAEAAGLEHVEFPGSVDYADAPRLMHEAHVALGAFGAGEKAGRVIPHKVYQGLASGRAVVTGDGEGLREFYEPGRHLLAVPRGDAGALTEALLRLIADVALRESLGREGRARTMEFGTAARVGQTLHDAIVGGGER